MPIDSVIHRDTFDVSPNWKWGGESGSRTRPAGFDAAEIGSGDGQPAKEPLTTLALNQKVDLKKPTGLIAGAWFATSSSGDATWPCTLPLAMTLGH